MRARKFVIALSLVATTVAGSATIGAGTGAVASQPAAAPAAARTATGASQVNVGSFNLFGVNNDKHARGEKRSWWARRPVVVRQIMSRRLDVVGLQEANQSTIYKSRLRFGSTQFTDLRGALRRHGGHYQLTNSAAYNCRRPMSTWHCRYRNQNATGSTRIIYNTDRLSLVKQGGYHYRANSRGKTARFMAWAIFRVKANGHQFLFTNTHLDPYGTAPRKKQWSEMIRKINSLKGSRPVVAVGDFNTSKFDSYAGSYLGAMRSNGYGDVVNQRAQSNVLSSRRAEIMTRAYISSYNGFRRSVGSYSYGSRSGKIGNGIDWIFATNSVRVVRWEVVASMNSHGRIVGVIPSDHHLVRATLAL